MHPDPNVRPSPAKLLSMAFLKVRCMCPLSGWKLEFFKIHKKNPPLQKLVSPCHEWRAPIALQLLGLFWQLNMPPPLFFFLLVKLATQLGTSKFKPKLLNWIDLFIRECGSTLYIGMIIKCSLGEKTMQG